MISSVVARSRRRPARPYRYSVPWRPTVQIANGEKPYEESVAAIAGTTIVATADQPAAEVPKRGPRAIPERKRVRRRPVAVTTERESSA